MRGTTITEIWQEVMENFQTLMDDDFAMWALVITAFICFILGRLSK